MQCQGVLGTKGMNLLYAFVVALELLKALFKSNTDTVLTYVFLGKMKTTQRFSCDDIYMREMHVAQFSDVPLFSLYVDLHFRTSHFQMIEFDNQKQNNCKASSKLIIRCVVSFIVVSFTQIAPTAVPRIFPTFSLLTHLSLTGIVLVAIAGLGSWCRRLLGVYASAPALVFFNLVFIWGVYVAVVRRAISPIMDIMVNGELVMLIFGLYRILSSDPGMVRHESSCLDELVEISSEVGDHYEENVDTQWCSQRIRYCRSCKAHIKGFDHHCPAFGNCIGQNNHVLFMALLIGFVITEATYISCASQFITESPIMDQIGWETNFSGNLAISTMTFSILQVLWQVVFLAWHVYCVCYNIKTDEWINWKKYPEFQSNVQSQSQPDQSLTETRFQNPYNKGIICNVKEFLGPKE